MISGNKGDGIDIDSDGASTLVEGNYIGTDQTGTEPLPNTGDGVSIDDASGVTIGATVQSAGNVISGNAQSGVSITGSTTTAVLILGNRIGTDYTAALPVGNASFGVMVSGTPGVVIGGTARVPEHHFGQHHRRHRALRGCDRRARRGQLYRHRHHGFEPARQRQRHPDRRGLVR